MMTENQPSVSLTETSSSSFSSALSGPSAARTQRRRRSLPRAVSNVVEQLELRQLLSSSATLTVATHTELPDTAVSTANGAVSYSDSIIEVDPVTPTTLVQFSVGKILSDGEFFLAGSYSTDGGTTWNSSALTDNNGTPILTAQPDPETFDTSSLQTITDISGGFDRSHNFYLLSLDRNEDGQEGALVLDKFNMDPSSPSFATLTSTTVLRQWDGASGPGGTADAVITPTLTVDDDASTNAAGGVVDPTIINGQSPIYIAWATVSAYNPGYTDSNPNAIELIESSDGGVTFSAPILVNGAKHTDDGERDAAPKIVVSQATANVAGGLVNVFWDDAGPSANGGGDTLINGQVNGGLATGGSVQNVAITPQTNAVNPAPVVTTATINVTGFNGDTAVTSLSDISLKLGITGATDLSNLGITLTSPGGNTITLFGPDSLTGTDLGVVNGNYLGTTFTDDAINPAGGNGFTAGPATMEFQPVGSFKALASGIHGANKIDGAWTLTITNYNLDVEDSAGTLVEADLSLSSGLTKIAQTNIANSSLTLGLTGGYIPANQEPYGTSGTSFLASPDEGVGPGLTVAADNTDSDLLHDFNSTTDASEEFQGDIYAAFATVDKTDGANPASNSDIQLWMSADGGTTWTQLSAKVNDDYGPTDGYSDDTVDNNGDPISGRSQFMPSLAVDQATGNVVLSWYDARWDASNSRVATYVAVSTDGGNTFLPETFANTPNTATDGITGATDTLGPIPDNFSQANPNRDAFAASSNSEGFGTEMGLATYGGAIYPAWIGNLNGLTYNEPMTAYVTAPGGPRVVSGDQGAIIAPGTVTTSDSAGNVTTLTYNGSTSWDGSTAADGRRQFDGFSITFDRYVQASSFTTASVEVYYHAPGTSGSTVGTAVPVANVIPLYKDAGSATEEMAYGFLIQVTPQSSVGTYSYVILPTAEDSLGNLMDQNGDGTGGEAPGAALPDGTTSVAGDDFAMPAPTSTSTQLGDGSFSAPYASTTSPLIIPGPYLVSSTVAGLLTSGSNDPTGAAASLLTNDSATSLTVTFDRDMDPSTVTAANIASIVGPSGSLTGPQRYNSADTPSTIKAKTSPAAITSSKIVVGSSYVVGAVSVQLSITEADVRDLEVFLVSPSGTRVALAQNVASAGADFTNTIFSASATTPIASGTAPYSIPSGYQPSGSLAAFSSQAAKGTWTLQVQNTASGAVGTLNYWSLLITPAASSFTVTHAAGDLRDYTVTFPAQSAAGIYTVTFNDNLESNAGITPTDTTTHLALDSNHDAGLTALDGTSSVGSTTTYSSTVVPISIAAHSTVTSTISISDSYIVQDLQLQLNIADTDDPELSATLTAPDGTIYTLFQNVGTAGTKRNFQNTLFSNSATTPIANGSAPFLGEYNPVTAFPLAADPSPTQVNGTWTLSITNSGTVVGSLTSWNLQIARPVVNDGLGVGPQDNATTSFRVFTFATSDTLSSTEWSSFSSTDNDTGDIADAVAGTVNDVTLDPSDPTGNTAYAAGASGGVWKTTDFLNASAQPTWVPLTDTGPNTSLNVGSIAVFGQNANPNDSVVVVGTGDPNTGTGGIGFLLSTDGGENWVVLDSSSNYSSAGNLLAATDPGRDHVFDGAYVYKVVVDPKPAPNGDVIIYAALGGDAAQAGVWRSVDSGADWTRVLAVNGAAATDVTLDPDSGTYNAVSNPSGNLQSVYAAFAGNSGIYLSPNRGSTWNQISGGVGNTLKTGTGFDQTPTDPSTFAATDDRITLAKPALTGIATEDKLYEGWLYALVSAPANGNVINGDNANPATFGGLWLTKDYGRNWVEVQLNYDNTGVGTPTNGTGNTNAGSVLDNPQLQLDSEDQALAIDPLNPNVAYVGGPQGVIRVDATGVADVNALYLDQNGVEDTLFQNSSDVAAVSNTDLAADSDPSGAPDPYLFPYVNLIQNPASPFASNSVFALNNAGSIANSGVGATWTSFGTADLGVTFNAQSSGTHALLTMVDPVTGVARIIVANDDGIYTTLDDGTGKDPSIVGSDQPALGARNGDLSVAQLYYGAVQPGLASNVSTSYFYADGRNVGVMQSATDPVDTGNTSWTGNTGYAGGVGVDQTNSNGAADVFREVWPLTEFGETPVETDQNFFHALPDGNVNAEVGEVSGLLQSVAGQDLSKDPQWPNTGNVNFAVNPISDQQIVIASHTGQVFSTVDQGESWQSIATPAEIGIGAGLDFTSSAPTVPALAFGAPDPSGSAGNDATNFFIYVGTAATGGHAGQIYVTFTGGGAGTNAWINLSAGLDGSTVESIVTDPTRGSHDAYAVTQDGIYYMADSTAANARWVNITGTSLTALTANAFGDPNQAYSYLSSFDTIAADWRYRVPGAGGVTYPVLYVGGAGGVIRSLDGGATWQQFPNISQDGASANGGLLPAVTVTDLSLSLGPIDPTTGYPDSAEGENILMATTYGRGVYAIRLAPVVLPSKLAIVPADNTSGLTTEIYTSDATASFTGYSEASAFGNSVTVQIFDENDPSNPVLIGSAVPTDTFGFFTVSINPGALTADGTYTLGFQATDGSGVTSSPTLLTYTLKTQPSAPPVVTGLNPSPTNDTGASQTDGKTSNTRPEIDGTCADANSTISVYSDGVLLGTTTSNSNLAWAFTPTTAFAPGTYQITATETDPVGLTTQPSAAYTIVIATAAPAAPAAPALAPADVTGSSNTYTSISQPSITGTAIPGDYITVYVDGTLVALGSLVTASPTGSYLAQLPAALADGAHTIAIKQSDVEGNASPLSPAATIVIESVAPPAPAAPTVLPADVSGTSTSSGVLTNVLSPRFTGTAQANGSILAFVDGTQVSFSSPVEVSSAGTYSFQLPSRFSNGTHTVRLEEVDLAGNVSALGAPESVTIDTVAPSISVDTITGAKGTLFSSAVATFTDPYPDGSVTITWGDGNVSSGTIGMTGGVNTITGSNTFARSGTFNFTVLVVDQAGNSSTATGTAIVQGSTVVATGGLTIQATEGTPLANQVVATFRDPTGAEPTSSYSASINWGDGTSAASATSITYDAATGVFSVLGSHDYAASGDYAIGVTISHSGANPTSVTSAAVVAVAPATVTCNAISAVSGVAFSGQVATFLVQNATEGALDSATIAWGDGTTSAGQIVQDASNPKLFHVIGTKTFAEPQSYTFTVTVLHSGGTPGSATGTATVADAPPTPTAVIPSVIFAGSVATFTVGATSASSTDAADGYTFVINWGDGSTPTTVAASAGNGSGVQVTRTYASTGVYTLTFTATDHLGTSATYTQTVTVAQTPTVSEMTINGTASYAGSVSAAITDVGFTLTDGSGAFPAIPASSLVLVRDASQQISIPSADFTFSGGTGTLNVSSLNLADGDYELQISVPNGPMRVVDFSKLAGDFLGTGVVTSKDVALLTKALKKTAGTPGYIAAGDFYGTGVITKADVAYEKKLVGHELTKTDGVIAFNPKRTSIKLLNVSFRAKAGSGIVAQDVVLTNPSATQPLDISNLDFTSNAQFSFSIVGQPLGTTSFVIPAGGSVRLRLYLQPVSVGTYTSFLIFDASYPGGVEKELSSAGTARITD